MQYNKNKIIITGKNAHKKDDIFYIYILLNQVYFCDIIIYVINFSKKRKVKKMIKHKIKAVISTAFLLLSLASCGNSGNFPVAEIKTEETSAPVTESQITEAVTEPPVTEDIQKKQREAEECMNIFSGISHELSEAYKVYNGFSIGNTDAECIVCNPFTIDIFYQGPVSEIKSDVYSAHPDAMECRLLNDPRFSSNDELFEYMSRFFSDEILRERTRNTPQFVRFGGNFYYVLPSRGLTFDEWQTEEAEITEVIAGESFCVTAYAFRRDSSEKENLDVRDVLTFTNTDEGWKVSKIKSLKFGTEIPE